MKKVSSIRIFTIATVSLLTLTLAACGQAELIENKAYIEPTYTEEVVFLEKFDNNHIDVQVGESKKMYTIPDSLQNSLKGIKKNDKLTIEYSLDKELKKQVKSILVDGKAKEVAKVTEQPKEELSESEPESTLKVYREGSWVKEEAFDKTSSGWNVKVLTGYELQDAKVVSKDDETHFVSFEKYPTSKEIKPMRWSASDDLKKIGDLLELKNEQIYDPNFRKSEFVFTASNDNISKKYVVRKEEDYLVQYIMVYPKNDTNNKVEAELWAMMDGIVQN